ncbi:MAG: hypothetical protein FFODKBPE_00380 [Candidatus Argoarchaeum ethanivorans]|uniref:Uncharacterized protein n=1 Tax=Candidatus Argoarchaeum ethanivorans TaxID=2608793 RepID=A0A811TDL3_9EURY|nr:MAG: hypothetical protein FFODKBPE_00380 [Candidatus Argoarchaeum ethanivorans]
MYSSPQTNVMGWLNANRIVIYVDKTEEALNKTILS